MQAPVRKAVPAEECLTHLRASIEDVLGFKSSSLSFEEQYRFALKLVTSRQADRLYLLIHNLIVEHVDAMRENMERHVHLWISHGCCVVSDEVAVLQALADIWKNYMWSLNTLCRIFAYMQRTYISNAAVLLSVYEMGVSLFANRCMLYTRENQGRPLSEEESCSFADSPLSDGASPTTRISLVSYITDIALHLIDEARRSASMQNMSLVRQINSMLAQLPVESHVVLPEDRRKDRRLGSFVSGDFALRTGYVPKLHTKSLFTAKFATAYLERTRAFYNALIASAPWQAIGAPRERLHETRRRLDLEQTLVRVALPVNLHAEADQAASSAFAHHIADGLDILVLSGDGESLGIAYAIASANHSGTSLFKSAISRCIAAVGRQINEGECPPAFADVPSIRDLVASCRGDVDVAPKKGDPEAAKKGGPEAAKMGDVDETKKDDPEEAKKGDVEEAKKAGMDSAPRKGPAPGPKLAEAFLWVECVHALFARFRDAVAESFGKEAVLERQYQDSLTDVINAHPRASEFISLYIDDALRSPALTGPQVEEHVDRGVVLALFLGNRDTFEVYYKRHLSRRLLALGSTDSAAYEQERALMTRLKVELGAHFVKNAQAMLQDLQKSQQDMADFEASADAAPGLIGASVTICTSNSWPLPTYVSHKSEASESDEFAWPPALAEFITSFASFYEGKHTGRKLTFLPFLGTVDMSLSLGGRTYEVNMPTACMLVLDCFTRGKDTMSAQEITDMMQLPATETHRALSALFLGRHRLLVKTPAVRVIEPSHTFALNDKFHSRTIKFKVMPVAAARAESDKQHRDTESKVDETRRLALQAYIVRTMKTEREMREQDLVHVVARYSLSKQFTAPAPVIKKAIEGLIAKDYLERGADSAVLKYLA